MATATVTVQIDVPDGVCVDEYERIEDGHGFHVSWPLPDVCRCETCKRESPLHLVEKNKFLVIRDLDHYCPVEDWPASCNLLNIIALRTVGGRIDFNFVARIP